MQVHQNTTSQRKNNSSAASLGGLKTIQKKAVSTAQQVPVTQTLKQYKFDGALQKMAMPAKKLLPLEPNQGKILQKKSTPIAPLQRKENKTGMPDNLKSGVENLSGMDLSDVKVHYNSSQPAQLNALAYAQGNDIHLGSGQERHLPHEAWHVVQQRQGRVQANKQMKAGVAINDDAGLEHEADVMGARALSLGTEPIQRVYEHTPLPTEAADYKDMDFKDDWEEVEAPEKQNISPKEEVWGTAKVPNLEDTELQNMNVDEEWEMVEQAQYESMEEGEEEAAPERKKPGMMSGLKSRFSSFASSAKALGSSTAESAADKLGSSKAGEAANLAVNNPTMVKMGTGIQQVFSLFYSAITKGKDMVKFEFKPIQDLVGVLGAIGSGVVSFVSLVASLAAVASTNNVRNEIQEQSSRENNFSRLEMLKEGLFDLKCKLANRVVDAVQSAITVANFIMTLISGGLLATINGAIELGNKSLTIARFIATSSIKLFESLKSNRMERRRFQAIKLANGAIAGNDEDCKLLIAMGVPSTASKLTRATGLGTLEDISTKEQMKKFAESLVKKSGGYSFDSFVDEIYNGLDKT